MQFEDKRKETAKKRRPPVRVPGVAALESMDNRLRLHALGVPIEQLDKCMERLIRTFGG